ncbi:MAG: enoyl-CoA hydratase-related protein [Pseudomonadota bacterium]
MSAEHITVDRDGAVMTVTIANEAQRNAIGSGALDRLDALADEIASDGEVRAVILTGAGERAFTSGFNLTELGDFKPENFLTSRFSDVFEKWAKLPVPVIGALNGHCMGGGVHVAVICDALISVPRVRFMIPAARFGFVYVPASIRRIAATLGAARASQLLYLNQECVAEDFVATGAVHRIVAADDLMPTAMEMAQSAARLSPLSVASMKEIVREAPDQARIEALVRQCAFSEDVVEGLAAMREKRSPVFSGK